MFGLGFSEIVLIVIIGLIVLGPKKLPEVAKALGKGYAEFKRALDDFKKAVNVEDTNTKPKESDTTAEQYKSKWEESIKESEQKESSLAIDDKAQSENKPAQDNDKIAESKQAELTDNKENTNVKAGA